MAMQIPPAQVVVALDIARESFAAVKRGDATVEQHEVVKLATDAKVSASDVDAAVAAQQQAAPAGTEAAPVDAGGPRASAEGESVKESPDASTGPSGRRRA